MAALESAADLGNSRFCNQQSLYVLDGKLDDFKGYHRALRRDFNYPTDATIEAWTNEMAFNRHGGSRTWA